jgi:hypothetical protein
MVTSRAVVLVLRKKDAKAEYWTRLTKEKPDRNWVKTDFSKVRLCPISSGVSRA